MKKLVIVLFLVLLIGSSMRLNRVDATTLGDLKKELNEMEQDYNNQKQQEELTKNIELDKKVEEFAKENNAVAGINAGGFEDLNGVGKGGYPLGTIIKDSKIIIVIFQIHLKFQYIIN